jgi:hypothetical protein
MFLKRKMHGINTRTLDFLKMTWVECSFFLRAGFYQCRRADETARTLKKK